MNSYTYSYRTTRVEKKSRHIAQIRALADFALCMAKSYCFWVVAILCITSALSCTPSLFMRYSFEQRGFQLLSDRALPYNSVEVVGMTREIVSESGLYRPDMKFKVYLCSRRWVYLLATCFSRDSKGAHVTATGRILINMKSIYGKNDLVRCIAHEVTHDMVRSHIGWRAFTIPTWVSEGYAEYVARRNWSRWEANKELLQLRSVAADTDNYGRYRLLVTYALDVWKVSLDDLFRKPPAMKELLFAMRTQTMVWLLGSIVGNSNEGYKYPGPPNNRRAVTGILITCPEYY